jgi:hypothetical protein
VSDTDDDRPAPPPRTDGPPPVLSRPLEEELRDPFGPVGPPPPRRPAPAAAPLVPPPPARSLLARPGEPSALFDGATSPLPPAPLPPAAVPSVDVGAPGPFAPPPTVAPAPPAPSAPTVPVVDVGAPGPGAPLASQPAPAVPSASAPVVAAPPAGTPPPPAPVPPAAPAVSADPFAPPVAAPSVAAPPAPRPDPFAPTPVPPSGPVAAASSLFSPPREASAAVAGPAPVPAPPDAAVPPAAPTFVSPPGGANGPSPWAPGPPAGGAPPSWPPPAGWPSHAAWPPPAGPAGAAPPPAPPTPRRIDPLTMVALGVAVLAAVASVIFGLGILRGGSTESAETVERTYPSTWDARVAPIAEWVADERDLEFAHPVEVVFQSEEEYLEEAAGDPTAASDEEQQEMDDFVATLRALGLVEGEVDLAAAFGDLASEGTLAYYDPATEVVSVRGDEMTPAVRVTVAHELTHVLQDQHFDLERLAEPDYERYEGLRAMAEGDAGRIEDAYAAEVLTTDEQAAYEAETEASVDGSEEALEGVPPVLSIIFSAPYALGEGFLAYREAADGGQPWDAVLEDPPSAEELLDPSVWGTERSAVAEVDIETPEGAEVLDEDTFDPLTWYLLLASRGDPAAALDVVDGWGGDAYVAYRRDDDVVCAALAVTGDAPADVDAFRSALDGWASGAPAGTTTVEGRDGGVEVHACDPGTEAAATGAVTEELLALPFLRADLEAQIIATGATGDQARCASGAMFEVLTIEQLTATTPDPAVQQEVAEAVMGCA